MRIKSTLIFIFCLPGILLAQKFTCGYKEKCSCARTGARESFNTVDFIIEGIVKSVDTVSIGRIISNEAKEFIKSDTTSYTACAKEILNKIRVLAINFEVNQNFGAYDPGNYLLICTPMEKRSCGYAGFKKGSHYIVYGTIDESADIYYTYAMDKQYFQLVSDYRHWTNFCHRTRPTEPKELEMLKQLKNKEK